MHHIDYKNTYSSWDEALPMGNGHYGGMCYLDPDDGLTFIINHYDVYYRTLYPRPELRPSFDKVPWGDYTLDVLKQRALDAHADPNHPAHNNYNAIHNPSMVSAYGTVRTGQSLIVAGRLSIIPNESILRLNRSLTRLNIEGASVDYHGEDESGTIDVHSFISPDADFLVADVRTSGDAQVSCIKLSVPLFRNVRVFPKPGSESDSVFYVENSFYCADDEQAGRPPFHYVWMLKLVGASGTILETGENGFDLAITSETDQFTVVASVVSEEETNDWLGVASKRVGDAAIDTGSLRATHTRHWNEFWSKSRIQIPDKMLETLWYLHIYALACCSGEGGRLFEQACGLNGLWDIKPPSQWGSSWYWDVNIEQGFWPLFTSNHLELAKPFHKGLLAYEKSARKWAKDFYGIDGIASDYPFDVYLCIWAWCAQYFWWYYTYSHNTDFLRDTAYPLMVGILDFWEAYLQDDPENGKLMIFPDVSPEQGPMTKNSTITVSCVKYLFKSAIEANVILNESLEVRKRWQSVLDRLPEYAIGESLAFGEHLKDSDWATTDQFLAHSSILMPIYPIGEISRKSDPQMRKIAENTLRYADAMQAIGTHNLGWPAAVAARLGNGDEALRMLYERGIDYQMRASGMLAEETERWMQCCLVACVPVYNPALVEAGSSIATALSEMLLQSFDGVIDVFPAVPSGNRSVDKSAVKFDKLLDKSDHQFSAWKDCAFEGLLAEGAFEVSSRLTNGQVEFISIRSLAGGLVKVGNVFNSPITVQSNRLPVDFSIDNNVISFESQAGCDYLISKEACKINNTEWISDPAPEMPLMYTAKTQRRVFLGKDEHTEFIRAIDNATLDYYPGDKPESRVTLYKFDFTSKSATKNYENILPKQYHNCGKQGLAFTQVTSNQLYQYTKGYGWSSDKGQKLVERIGPDELRYDFVEGRSDAEFKIELNKGSYRITLIVGDLEEGTYTSVNGPGGVSTDSGHLLPGVFKALELPFILDKEQIISLKIGTDSASKWTVCAMFLNRFP